MHLTSIPGRRTAALLLCAGSLTLAACGSSDDDEAGAGSGTSAGTASANTADAGDRDTARLRLQECLREQGIDLPDTLGGPGGGGGAPPADLDRDAIQEALEGPCEDLAQGAFGDISEEDQQEFQDQLQEFRQCMQEQGVEVPDFRPGQGAPPAADGLDPDDPDVRDAMEQCQDAAPNRGRLGGGGQDDR